MDSESEGPFVRVVNMNQPNPASRHPGADGLAQKGPISGALLNVQGPLIQTRSGVKDHPTATEPWVQGTG